MLRQEMNIGYFDLIHRPGEKLGVLDNGSDFESCQERTHCNCTHGCLAPKVIWDEGQRRYVLDDTGLEAALKTFRDTIQGRRHTILGGGEHNNVYFPGFYHYKANIPQALMQDPDGNYLELHDPDILEGNPIPMPAIDDPGLLKLYAQQLSRQAERMPGCHHVAAYVMGAEMLYPEYFGLGHGDYRPASWAHFTAWCQSRGAAVPKKKDTLQESGEGRRLWLHYREQAMADRAAYYYQAILAKDNTHLCFYPTHGSALHGDARCRLGQQPDTLSAACDGIEMGHILIDDDAERRNVILTCLNASYGAPVIVPRLGNKTADLSAAGGGRSFTPETLRRLVYEDVGMGISIIFPIHWRSHLHDGEWFIKNTPAEQECRRVFDEIIIAAPYLMGMGRLQPQAGVLAADDTWLDGWQMRWTALMQDALDHRENLTIMTDALIQPGLARRMPLLISVDNGRIASQTLRRLNAYLEEGGKLMVWGDFALGADAALREGILAHPRCRVSHAPLAEKERVIREMFLTGMREGTTGTRYRLRAVDYSALRQEAAAFAPEVILRPFQVEGDAGKVNLYPLTDRGAIGCVCINNGSEEAVFSIAPDARLMAACQPVDMLTGRPAAMPLTLPPHGTRMIYFGPPAQDVEDAVCQVEDAYQRWQALGAQVGALRQHYSSMRTGWHHSKRLALAQALLHSLALRCAWEKEEDGALTVRAEAYDAQGKRVTDALVDLRITPGSHQRYAFSLEGEAYVCRIPAGALPRIYDPECCAYRPLAGPARLILQAETQALQGGCILNVQL